MATAVGNIACIEVLLAAGASMAVQTTSPVTATSHLLGMSGAIIFLQGSTSLHFAAQCNRTAIIRLLLKVSIQQNSNRCRTSFGFLESFAPALLLFISTGFVTPPYAAALQENLTGANLTPITALHACAGKCGLLA